MAKLRPLRPTLREQKRYIAFKIISESTFTFNQIQKELSKSLLEFLGTLHMAHAGVMILKEKFNEQKQAGIIRVSAKTKDHVIAALALISNINAEPAIIKTLTTSGMITKAYNSIEN